jgi:hypothetical protein
MKTNVILGSFALCCAVGSAIASSVFAPTQTYVQGTSISGQQVCESVGLLCDPTTTTTPCKVNVVISSGATKSTKGYAARNGTTCINPLFTTNVYAVNRASILSDVTPY